MKKILKDRFPETAFVAVAGMLALAGGEAAETVQFDREVLPILAHHCRKCHGSDKNKGGLSLHTREAALRGGDGGPALTPGDSGASEMFARISTDDPDLRMPPKGAGLTADEIGVIEKWIDEGAAWDGSPDSRPYSMDLREVTPPPGEGHSVDRFLDSYFAEQKVTPPEPVSDAAYIRRVYLDVTGLPPLPQELAEFLTDESPDRYAAMVRRALDEHDSYVQHWMTFWSDHLQVGGSLAGAVFNGDHTAAPRDWLMKKLATETRYNHFVNDLISGEFLDLYGKSVAPPGETASPASTASMQSANMVAHVFLGVQMKCASCHDSFIDRWRMEDSWGLANALAHESSESFRCNSPTGTITPPRFPFPELGAIDSSLGYPDRKKRVAQLVVDGRNGLFHRTIANRIWAQLFGRGIIEPLDEMVEKEAWHPELLEWLAMELRRRDYDMKEFLFLLMTSEAYRYPGVARAGPIRENDTYVFQGPEVRRLTAEQFLDTLSLVSDSWNSPASSRRVVERSWRYPNDLLMVALGRPSRDIIVTSRETTSNVLQTLELMNGEILRQRIEKEASELSENADTAERDEIVAHLHQLLLARSPTASEMEIAAELVGETPSTESLADWIWILLSLPEFQLL